MFSPIKNTKVYEQVIDQIKNMIADGTLKRGDKLPSERDLVAQLQVSRTSIREALRSLEIIGLVECKQGEGNFIKESFTEGLFEPLSVMFMLQESRMEEVLGLRRIIEVETAVLAAKRINAEELNYLNNLISKLRETEDEKVAAQIDKQFHYEIAKASGNFLILNILNTVSYLIDSFIKDARSKILAEEKNKNILINQHEYIYKGLLNHSAEEASNAMREHLDFANKYMMK
jgi:GntR family transcriptional regulator, transcriptional repressor for pyruvate dehydrogenase complex